MLLFLLFIFSSVDFSSQVVIGCGGFVKSDAPISYSRVEIKLYSKQGSLKYQTECAPNNGYYLIPLYDKGDYVLRVEPPAGWSFQPSSVPLHIDDTGSDPCSQGKDINFHFKGFSIIGKVVNRGEQSGPPNVEVSLLDVEGKTTLATTFTTEDGTYNFSTVLPGSYRLQARHSAWTFDQQEAAIVLEKDNLQVPSSLVIGGYDVHGEVASEGEPIQGVHFLLFSSKPELAPPKIDGCQPHVPKGFKMESHPTLVYHCHVTSTAEGKFVFPSIPPGHFVLIPFYKGEYTAFEVSPPKVELDVGQGSIIFPNKFQVQGFSVSGRVLQSVDGPGISGAVIFLNGKQQAVTQQGGWYHLENMRAGSYHLEVKVEHLGIVPQMVKITPNSPQLPDMVVSTMDICGKLVVSKPFSLSSREIAIRDKDGAALTTVHTSQDGTFCHPLPPGTYTVKPLVKNDEKQNGLLFSPETKIVTLSDKPILDLEFNQFFASLSGEISCLLDCKGIAVQLHSSQRKVKQDLALEDGQTHFTFDKILPGKYEVSLLNDDLCWESTSVTVQIVDQSVKNILFKQTGYKASITLSHPTSLQLKSSAADALEEMRHYPSGTTSFCLPKPGNYTLIPQGCHKFLKSTFIIDTSGPLKLYLKAIEHQLSGSIIASDNITDLHLELTQEGEAKKQTLSIPQFTIQSGDKYIYSFDLWVKPNIEINIQPLSKTLLFNPQAFTYRTQDDCMQGVVQFKAQAGLFINGIITPPIEGVKITIKDANKGLVALELVSDKDGKYSVGPLDGEIKYEVDAVLEGYVFTPVPSKMGHFNAFKLAEVSVQVVGESGEPLEGVLMSLSGGADYRKNSVTGDNGKLSFKGLSPGQYFLRSVLKEYKFEPTSKIIDVAEGALVPVTVKGKRVAFSCYGITSSLTGEAEPGVSVEAVGLANCSQYQEEVVSDQDGTFRIRGLLPYCEYALQLKAGSEADHHIERAVPRRLILKVTDGDLTDQRLIIMRRITQMDVTGNIIAKPEHLSNLKVKLYKGEDNLIHSITMSVSSFFQLPALPIDNASYTLVLEGAGSASSAGSPPTHFRANTTVRHFLLYYEPRPRAVEQELTQGSYLLAPLTFLLILLTYNHARLRPLGNYLIDTIQGLLNSASPADSPTNETVQRAKKKPKKI